MKITNKRELAIRLSNGAVSKEEISTKLNRTVNMWLRRNQIVLIGNKYSL